MSGGVSSFIAGLLSDARHGNDSEWIYIHVADQHEDTLRFVHDCEQYIGRKITILQSQKYSCVADVCRAKRYTNSPHGAPCTGCLKKNVRKNWEKPFLKEGIRFSYVWGMDGSEGERAARMITSEKDCYDHEFPLIDMGLSKADCHYLIGLTGVKRPIMYDLGFPNNNCICCCRGGRFSWNLCRKYFPEKFAERAALERELGHTFLKDCFLDELPEGAGRKTQHLENPTFTLNALMAAGTLGLITE